MITGVSITGGFEDTTEGILPFLPFCPMAEVPL